MELTDNVAKGRQVIEGYGDGTFRVSGAVHRGSVLVFADRTLAWEVSDMTELSVESLAALSNSSRSAFAKRFHDSFDRTPMEYVRDVRLPFRSGSISPCMQEYIIVLNLVYK